MRFALWHVPNLVGIVSHHRFLAAGLIVSFLLKSKYLMKKKWKDFNCNDVVEYARILKETTGSGCISYVLKYENRVLLD